MDASRLDRRQKLWVAVGDPAEVVVGVVGVARPADVLNPFEPPVAVAVAFSGRVDGLVLAPRGHPHRAVQLVGVVYSEPGTAQRVGVGRDVVGVLVPALPRIARRLEEEHGLEREHVGPDQGL